MPSRKFHAGGGAVIKLGAVLLHYRFWPHLRPALESLLAQTRPPEAVLVVDNASGDGSVEQIRAAYPSIEVLEAPSNGGYATGMNLGARRLIDRGFDALLFQTHECVLQSDVLEVMAGRMQSQTGLGAAGPLLGYVSRPEVLWSAGGMVEARTGRPNHLGTGDQAGGWLERGFREVAWLDGACLLVRAAALEQAGFFDEAFFLYFEESDFLCRLRSLGWRVECCPAIARQEPSPMPPYLRARNQLRFMAKNAPRRFLAREMLSVARHALRGSLSRDPSRRAVAALQRAGLRDFMLRRWGPPSPR